MGRTSLLNVTVVFEAARAAVPIKQLISQAARDTRSDFTRNYLHGKHIQGDPQMQG
jgi:hypothetical protein